MESSIDPALNSVAATKLRARHPLRLPEFKVTMEEVFYLNMAHLSQNGWDCGLEKESHSLYCINDWTKKRKWGCNCSLPSMEIHLSWISPLSEVNSPSRNGFGGISFYFTSNGTPLFGSSIIFLAPQVNI